MKKECWFLLVISAVLYASPFFLSNHFWWLIFLFPVPLLYVTLRENLSFIHGYFWGCIVFALHLSGGIYLVADMADQSWYVGIALGVAMVLYQALVPAFLFWCATLLCRGFGGQAIVRLCILTVALWFFIIWVDWYCLWIFGGQEGYPLMQPLLLLAQQPTLLCLLPIVGKPLLTLFFLLIPASVVIILWYQSFRALLFVCVAMIFWLFPLVYKEIRALEDTLQQVQGERVDNVLFNEGCDNWQDHIKSLPHMFCCTSDDPMVIIKIVSNQIKKLVACYPKTEIIIMPESAFNISNFAELSELLQLWNEDYVGKPIHVIFGASRWNDGDCYNSLHWVYNGVLQGCYDKKHAMLISERLATWMNYDYLNDIYFNVRQQVAVSRDERRQLFLLQNMSFVPYICSELFFNEWPDEISHDPIIAIVNDLLFLPYIQKLLVLLARFKAIQWQRDIIYVSYTQSLFIDRWGLIQPMRQ